MLCKGIRKGVVQRVTDQGITLEEKSRSYCRERKKGTMVLSENRMENDSRRSSGTAAAQEMSREELHRQMQQSLSGGQRKGASSGTQRKNTSTKSVSELSGVQSSSSTLKKRSQSQRSGSQTTQPKTTAEEKMEKMRRIKESMSTMDSGSRKGKSSTAEEAQRYVQRQASSSRRKRVVDDTYDDYDGYHPKRSYRQAPAPVVEKKSRVGIIVVSAILIVILLIYVIGMLVCSRGFLPRTYMNDVDIGGMSMDEATAAVVQEGETQGLTFVKKNGEEVHFEGEEFGSAISLGDDTAFQEAADQSVFLWFVNYFSPAKYTTQLVNTYDESKLATLVRNYTWGTAPPTDAYLQKQSDGTYEIVPEDDGDMVDVETLVDYTLEQVGDGHTTISLEDCGCYLTAEKTAADLETAKEEANSMMGLTITYEIGDRSEVLDAATLVEWVSSDSSGNLTVDENAAQAWVQTNLADKYDTYVPGYTRTFQSTMQGTIELPLGEYGIYGWQTDVEATAAELADYIKQGESVSIEPVYSQEAYCRDENDIGDTYIEVDITNQHVWFYKDGSLLMDSDCVTGLATDPDRETPTGVFRVWSRESPATLVGEDYSTPVTYWMPVTYTGVGLHDLSRTEYGGEVYKTNGSHGCINLPVDFAGELYDAVEVGTPVLIIP
jgi:hypothetical protein